jgi:excisionase family DNA binding protein
MEECVTFETLPQAVSQLFKKLDSIERLLERNEKQAPRSLNKQLLTVEEAAKFLTLAVPTIYSKVSKKELPFMKKNGRLYFSQSELLEYVKTGQEKSIKQINEEADTFLIKKGGYND